MSTLSSVKFYRVFYVDPAPGKLQTILSFSFDYPALIERQVDLGKVCALYIIEQTETGLICP